VKCALSFERHVTRRRDNSEHQILPTKAMASGYSAHAVANKLRKCKNRLQEEVRELNKPLPESFHQHESQDEGTFWTYLVRDVTDVDLRFAFRQRATGLSALSLQEAEGLHSAAAIKMQGVVLKYRLVFSFNTSGTDPRLEVECDNWEDCRREIMVLFTSPLLFTSL
jgi:hypothetical protein